MRYAQGKDTSFAELVLSRSYLLHKRNILQINTNQKTVHLLEVIP